MRSYLLSTLLVPLLTFAVTAQQGRYRFIPRDTLRYREITEGHIVLRPPGDSVPIMTRQDATFAITGEQGDTATAWYEQLSLSGTSPMGETNTNTDGALHLPFRLVIAPSGQTTLIAAPAFPAEVAAQTDLSRQFEDCFITVPRAVLKPNATWADTVENSHPAGPRETTQSRHIRRYRVLRDTVAAGGVAAVVIAIDQEMTLRNSSPLEAQQVTVVTELRGSEEGTAVFAPKTGRLLLRVRRGRMEGEETLQGQGGQMVVPMKFEYTSNLALLP